MSANNFILIKEQNSGFLVAMKDVETHNQMGKSIKCKSLYGAIVTAKRIMETEEVEYGIDFALKAVKHGF